MSKRVAIIFGLGGSLFDPASGEVQLAARLRHAGFEVGGPYGYRDRSAVYNFLHTSTASFRAIIGDSFGADFGPLYAGDLGNTKLDYLGGFQPSMYADDVRNGQIVVPKNVVYAHCIRDPVWIDTGGLGYATWVAQDPKATTLLVTEHRGAHPDDWGYSQDLIYAEIKHKAGL